MKVLDLFAGEGGASKGYANAGLTLLAAVDLDANRLQHHWAFGDGLTFAGTWEEGLEKYAADADLIHASPPCQAYSVSTRPDLRSSHPDLVGPVRDALRATGKPFVIENVEGAPLEDPVWLTGCMFGLTVNWDVPKTKVFLNAEGLGAWKVNEKQDKWVTGPVIWEPITFHLERKRGFEIHGFNLADLPRDPVIHQHPAMVITDGTPTGFWNQWYAQAIPSEVKKNLMRTGWTTGVGTAEAIPPAYSQHIGREFLRQATSS